MGHTHITIYPTTSACARGGSGNELIFIPHLLALLITSHLRTFTMHMKGRNVMGHTPIAIHPTTSASARGWGGNELILIPHFLALLITGHF
jgi:hypothetical protein